MSAAETERNREIAGAIMRQIVGPRFVAMTGAKTFMFIRNGLQIDLPRTPKNKATKVQIVLAGNDTYTMAFYRMKGLDCIKVEPDVNGIYCDQLIPIFENRTGLRTSL